MCTRVKYDTNLNELFSKYKIKEFKVIRKNGMIVQLEKLILSKGRIK